MSHGISRILIVLILAGPGGVALIYGQSAFTGMRRVASTHAEPLRPAAVTSSPVFLEPYVEITNGRTQVISIRTGTQPTIQSDDPSIVSVSNGMITGRQNGSTSLVAYDPSSGLYDTCTVLVVPWIVGASQLLVDNTLPGLRADVVAGDTVFFQGAGGGYSYFSLYTAVAGTGGSLGPVLERQTFFTNDGTEADLMKAHPTPFGNFFVDTRTESLGMRHVYRAGPLLQNAVNVGSIFPADGTIPCQSWILPAGITHDFANNVFIGEYNVQTIDDYQIKIYRGSSNGTQWSTAYTFPPRNVTGLTGGVRHVHAVQTDPYSGDIWIGTGDNDDQSRIYFHTNHLLPDNDGVVRFNTIGAGSQQYRTVSFAFTPDYIYWFMDSATEPEIIFRVRRSGIHPAQNPDGTYTAEPVATIADKPFYNNCPVPSVGSNAFLLETVYENAAQYGTAYRELDDRNRVFLLRETPNGTAQIQQVSSAEAPGALAQRTPIGQLANGTIILVRAVRGTDYPWMTELVHLQWNNASLGTLTVGTGVTTTFDDLRIAVSADVSTGGYISAWEVSSPPQVAALPQGVSSVSPFYWDVQAANSSFSGAIISLSRDKLTGLGPDSSLVVLQQQDGGWINLGGTIANGYLRSTTGLAALGIIAVGIKPAQPASPPPAPILVYPAGGATAQPIPVTLRWQRSAGAVSYRLQLSTDSIYKTIIQNLTLSDTTSKIAGLQYSTMYYWRVAGINSAGTGPWSARRRFVTLTPPPSPLLVLPVNNATGQSAMPSLIWRKASTATSYRIQISTDSTFGIVTAKDTVRKDTALIAGPLQFQTRYFWRVRAINAAGVGSWSSAWRFSTTTMPPPILVYPAGGATGQPIPASLRWQRIPGATSYRVQLSIDSLYNVLIRNVIVPDSAYKADSLHYSTMYYWRVAGISGATGPWSARRRFVTLTPPTAVTLVSPGNGATAQPLTPLFVWRKIRTASAYRFQVAIDSTFSGGIVKDTVQVDTVARAGTLQQLTVYYWRVVASNAAGTGPWSFIWDFTTTGASGRQAFTSINTSGTIPPMTFILHQNYPNPFNPATTIGFTIGSPSLVTIKIYDVLGQEIAVLLDRTAMDAGQYSIPFDAGELPSGIYYCRTVAEETGEDGVTKIFISVGKMLYVR